MTLLCAYSFVHPKLDASSVQQKTVIVTTNKFVKKLTTIPVGRILGQHLDELKERPYARDSFVSAMRYPAKRLEDRFSKLDLEGRPVQVIPFATEEDCGIITDSLKQFDPCYDPQYRAKSQLKKMPGIAEFMRITLIMYRICTCTDFVQYSF